MTDIEREVWTCPSCGREFQPRQGGRGGRSRYCSDCQAARRSQGALLRGQRRTLTMLTEMVEVGVPIFERWREEVREKQSGTCHVCGREVAHLYLAVDGTGTMFGLCLLDFEAWVAERRGRNGG